MVVLFFTLFWFLCLHAHATMWIIDCVCVGLCVWGCVWGCLLVCRLTVKCCFWPVLSADRVEQMAKTYNDIEVVSHLLAEVGVPSLVQGTILFCIKKRPLIG